MTLRDWHHDAMQYRDLDLAAQAKAEAEIFGPPISTYTRAQAIADGVLVDVTETAREAGFPCPVALTRAVWIDCVEWTDADRTTERCQDEAGRLWDVLWMGSQRCNEMDAGQAQAVYRIKRVPRSGNKQLVNLKLHIGPGDDGRPVATIMFPD